MIEREKVIYSLERCTCHVPDACRDCAYDAGHPYNECVEMLMKDALELLKAQEPIAPKILDTAVPVSKTAVRFVKTYWCGACGEAINQSDVYCRKCGQAVKWDEPPKEET